MVKRGRMRLPFSLVLVGLLTNASSAQQPNQASDAGGSAAQDDGWTQRFDQLWPQRDDSKAFQELYQLAKGRQTKNPVDFEANWRLAAAMIWQSDGLADGTNAKALSGKEGAAAAEKAIAVNPQDVRAQYYAGTGLGLYSEGVGILTALGEGLEGKFRTRVQAALNLNKDFLDGAPQVLWGRYFFKLPWPKRDVSESIKVLRSCVQEHPNNLRAKLYLAESLLDDGKKQEAKQLVEQIAAAPIGVDPPEDRRIKARAAQWAKQHQHDLG